jgi:hypothetical protein
MPAMHAVKITDRDESSSIALRLREPSNELHGSIAACHPWLSICEFMPSQGRGHATRHFNAGNHALRYRLSLS